MWDRLEPLMPTDPVRGRRWADHRRTSEATAWMYCTGSPWRDLPEGRGSFQTAHKRLLRWAMDGTWGRILAAVLAVADGADEIGWTVVSRLHGLPGPPARRRSQERGLQGRPNRRPRAGTLARRPGHEGPSRQRQPCAALAPSRHRRSGGRHPDLLDDHGRHPCSAKRTWPAVRSHPERSGATFADAESARSSPSRPTW